MVSVKKHWVLLQPPLSLLGIVVCHRSDPWQEIVLISDDIHLASHTTRRASGKQNTKPKRTSDLPPVIWKRQETTKAITVSMSFISELCSMTALCVMYQSLWEFLKSSEWPSHQNEIS